MLTRLPPVPIIVDYLNRDIVWNFSAQNRLNSALRYPNRVCRIAIPVTPRSYTTIYNALDTRFPTLESLIINNMGTWEFNFPPKFLMTSTKSLRRLTIGARLVSLPPLLSVATMLIDLTLRTDTIVCPQPGVSLLPLLQCLPCLRHLDLYVQFFHSSSVLVTSAPLMKTNDIISLPELTHLRLKGNSIPVEFLIPRLATPSLQELHVSLYRGFQVVGFQIPHLTRFICNARMIFRAAQLKFSFVDCIFSLLTHSHFIDDPPFNVIGSGLSSVARMSSVLPSLLATVEDVFFFFRLPATYIGFHLGDLTPWRDFFRQLPNVKILRILHGIEMEVANMLRQGIDQPTTGLLPVSDEEADVGATVSSIMPIDSSQLDLAFLPSLEGIEVYSRSPGTPIPERERASVLEPFEVLFAARRQTGRPVKVYWNTDEVLPASFYDKNV
jgi:hypothetical protein